MIRRRLGAVLVSIMWLAVSVLAQAPPAGQTPSAQDGFVPITELPPTQQLPAAPYLIAAYAFIWIALLAYLFSIWRRLGRVEQDMRSLGERSRKGGAR